MAEYVLTTTAVAPEDQTIFRRSDGAYIRADPADPNHADLAEWRSIPGNVPDPPMSEHLTGVVLKSTSTPALNGTYDLVHREGMTAITLYEFMNGSFPNGAATIAWSDMHEFIHTFTSAHWRAFVSAMTDYTTSLTQRSTPPQPLVIP